MPPPPSPTPTSPARAPHTETGPYPLNPKLDQVNSSKSIVRVERTHLLSGSLIPVGACDPACWVGICQATLDSRTQQAVVAGGAPCWRGPPPRRPARLNGRSAACTAAAAPPLLGFSCVHPAAHGSRGLPLLSSRHHIGACLPCCL